jgi:hypothetical protein
MKKLAKASLALGFFVALACAPRQPSATGGGMSDGGACDVSNREKITEVKSSKYGYGIMLPSEEWQLDCDKQAPLAGSWKLFHLSIEHLADDLAPAEERERLERLLERLKAENQENGLSVVSPKIERSENKLTLLYELEGQPLAEAKAKSAHVFATITPRQGPLILHISWTGPEAEYKENWPELLRVMTIPFLAL